ncbi:kinase-like protein [Violaceomyces palustris]|uniref:Kinase-like protein n=1 Tax=Violaceomyces palustris TaxID=1673888 RepID=A0ACD0NTK4_9BASI|nr:kinase-like protein [Violaceomyces palustris]
MTSSPRLSSSFSPELGPLRDSASRDRDKDGLATKLSKWRAASHIGSVVDDWPMYSANGDDYVIGDVIGFGASSVVHQGIFRPLGKACAIKIIDLEAYGRDTEELRRETQLMSLSKHPNVLRVRGCWVSGSKLHIATRLMSSGSMLDIMRFSYSEGFDEVVIATVLKQALEGLTYLHVNGWLHRDLKAANMLVDEDGTVLLGDFGVGVFVGESDKNSNPVSTEGKRKSFVGTPCWMAPEVIERKHYGTKADIWSFGITALELAQGRAPYSRLNPVKVLMRTMQDEPPQLDRNGNAHKYSKIMEDFVRLCLQKDPSKRPSADKLLGHAFFKQARPPKYLVTAILVGLPPLAERQEKRRRMSVISMREIQSWDFGSLSSKTATPSLERGDPFRNFSGIVSLPSPHGSVRSMKLVSIDGQHVLATEDDEDSVDKVAQAFMGRFTIDRNRSSDGASHRKSVSFESLDAARIGQGEDGTPFGGSSLPPIGEKSTPLAGASLLDNENEIPPLQLSEDRGKMESEGDGDHLEETKNPVGGLQSSNSSGNSGSDSSPRNDGSESSSPRPETSTPRTSSAPSSVAATEPEKVSGSKIILQRVMSGAAGGGGKNKADGNNVKRESVLGKFFRGSKR